MSHGRTLAATLADKRQKKNTAEAQAASPPVLTAVSWVGRASCLLAAVVFSWLRGGVDYSAHFWLAGLLFIALAAWWIECLLDRTRSVGHLPLMVVPVILGIGLGCAQLIPLSDNTANWLAPKQRELLDKLASPAGMFESPPTPVTHISLDPVTGRIQISLLVIGLAGLALGAHYFKSIHHAIVLLAVVGINAALVSIAGLLQRVQFGGQTLLSDALVKGVHPFATFVNRNNAAAYLLMGLACALGLAFWTLFSETGSRRPRAIVSKEIPVWRQIQQRIGIFISQLTPTRCACLILCAVIALGIVGSLSRGGVLALLVGGLLTAISFGTVRDSESRIGWAMLALAGVIGLSLWLGFGSRLAARFEELNDPNAVTTLNRMRNWSDTLPAAWDFGLLGSGLGSYHAVHRLYRSDVEERVFERADNQYFQTLIEGGWLGFGLLLAALALAVWTAVFVSSKGNSVKSLAIGVTNMFLITSIAVSSLGDYGLEIPQNTILMALLVGLTSNHVHAFASRLKKKFFLRHVLPRWAGLLVVAGTTLGLLFAARHLWALAQQERMGATAFLRETQDSLPAEQAQRQIEQLEPLVAATPTYWGYRRLGELYVHRYRLAQYATIQNRLDASPAKLWESTNLVNLYEQMQQLKRIADRRLIEAVGASDDAQKFIVPAWRAFVASRNSLPFQTDVQLMLGQIQSIFGDESKSQICLERATLTAPTNADYAYIIGLMHLHAGRTSDAASAWRRCLSLKPYPYFDRVLERVHSLPSDRWRIDPQVVLEQIVPRDPTLLYNFCKTHLADQKYAQLRKQGLQWADQVQADLARRSDPKDVWLGIQIKLALGENEEALNQMKWLVQLSPPNMRMEDIRFQMAQLMFEESQFEEAYETIKWLRKNDSLNLKRYSGLYEKLRQKLGISSAE